ncbi:phage protein NinX family protein [Paraburkholderia sp. C35]|uniref:phage protein NinX family protein n=1 Tax=Paraburkholderia sp. C35 TaxID=2126993 RepID=UPI000D68AAF8|nr:phage protein NinX family protein [Paraburkholderia sp. C35]
MKVSELTGATLDVWVAIALGEKRSERHIHNQTAPHMYWLAYGERGAARVCPQYSSNPRDAMTVIERFKPTLEYRPAINEWASNVPHRDGLWRTGFGETAAIAVCRAVVLAHFGYDVQFDTKDEPA